MMLADLGAEIIRVDRPGGYPAPDQNLDFEQFGKFAFYNRNRRTVRIPSSFREIRGIYRPTNTGLRFSWKALIPSRASTVREIAARVWASSSIWLSRHWFRACKNSRLMPA
jgi:hypothetical protein